jgi:2',3'-cyclic-nucleotide 2'-phosphodiesterase (5'-nucleotidase family)
MQKIFFSLIVASCLFQGCFTHQHIAHLNSSKNIAITQSAADTNAILALLAPYSQELSKTMNDIVGHNSLELKKDKPSGSLGNMVSDAMLFQAKKINPKVQICVSNHGGVRIPNLGVGPITLGKVYELMPFDNTICIMELSGLQLDSLCQAIAGAGGHPIAGFEMKISDKKAKDITINGSKINENETYIIAVNDYIANGGDNNVMLARLPKADSKIMVRDAIINYLKHCNENKKDITPNPLYRIK